MSWRKDGRWCWGGVVLLCLCLVPLQVQAHFVGVGGANTPMWMTLPQLLLACVVGMSCVGPDGKLIPQRLLCAGFALLGGMVIGRGLVFDAMPALLAWGGLALGGLLLWLERSHHTLAQRLVPSGWVVLFLGVFGACHGIVGGIEMAHSHGGVAAKEAATFLWVTAGAGCCGGLTSTIVANHANPHR